jgi:hypothetical protein
MFLYLAPESKKKNAYQRFHEKIAIFTDSYLYSSVLRLKIGLNELHFGHLIKIVYLHRPTIFALLLSRDKPLAVKNLL